MIRILLILLAIFGAYRVYDHLTDDFQVAHITYALPYRKEWETSPITPEAELILKQPFYYIGKGSQSYVFKSEDQKYVIKFFKFKHMKPSWLLNALPHVGWIASWQDYRDARHQKKINRLFVGYKIAHDYNKEDSGLIYLHLNQSLNQSITLETAVQDGKAMQDFESEDFPIGAEHSQTVKAAPIGSLMARKDRIDLPSSTAVSRVTLFDKLGFQREIPLKDTSFIVQEAAIPTQEILEKADRALAAKRIEQLLAMYLREYQKGIYDKDHAVLRNTGFIGERPIHFDVGNFVIDPSIKDPANYEKDLAIIKEKLAIHK